MAIASASGLFGSVLAQDSEQSSSSLTYHATGSEVRLVFFGADENNHAIENLRRDDFAVVDQELVIRDFRSFSRRGAAKLDLIVLVDASDSVLPHSQREWANVAQVLSRWPQNPPDSLTVASFSGTEVHPVCAGHCSSLTADQIAYLPRGGPTPLFDALDWAATLLIEHQQTQNSPIDVWPVIVLFSDGDDTISKTSFRDAYARLMASGAQVYAVDLGHPERSSEGGIMLERIARDSGGRRLPIAESAGDVLTDIFEDLRSAWLVTYALPQSGPGFHSVRILPTRNLNFQFRCRRGYYHSPSGSHSEEAP